MVGYVGNVVFVVLTLTKRKKVEEACLLDCSVTQEARVIVDAMFFRGKGSSTDSTVPVAGTGASSEQNANAVTDAESPPTSSKFLLCRIVQRFHCVLKAYLCADTVLGRSLANLEDLTKIRRYEPP